MIKRPFLYLSYYRVDIFSPDIYTILFNLKHGEFSVLEKLDIVEIVENCLSFHRIIPFQEFYWVLNITRKWNHFHVCVCGHVLILESVGARQSKWFVLVNSQFFFASTVVDIFFIKIEYKIILK